MSIVKKTLEETSSSLIIKVDIKFNLNPYIFQCLYIAICGVDLWCN